MSFASRQRGRKEFDLAVSPIWPRQSMRIISQTGSVALGALLLSGSEGLNRFPACVNCIHTRFMWNLVSGQVLQHQQLPASCVSGSR